MDSQSSSLCESFTSSRATESSSTIEDLHRLFLNGALNLSNKQLTKLPACHNQLYANVLSLNVSGNRFRKFEAANMFVNCVDG
uniref:Uncharacterized protein n=1 Tax=Ditylenchus dipsaci TaxID=166011 RepID=A0A915E8G5_9BILA